MLGLFRLNMDPLEKMLQHVAQIQMTAQEMLGSSGQLIKNLDRIDHYRDLRARYIKWMALYNAVDEAIERTFNTEGFPNIYDVAIGSTSECRAKLNEASRIINAPIASLFLAELSKFDEFDAEEGKTILKKLGVYTEYSGKIVVDENGAVTLEDSTGGESIEIRQPQNNTWEYTIQPGDTLSEIAEKYHTTVNELCELNGITNPNLINAGAMLLIPTITGMSQNKNQPSSNSSSQNVEKDSETDNTVQLEHHSDNAEINTMLERLLSDNSLNLSEEKKACMCEMAKALLEEGYESEFVAGVLGNIASEGTAGTFESSSYITYPEKEPSYLKYMDANYNYRSRYSGQNIEGKSLSEINDMLSDLEANGYAGKFGLGSVQWTGSRTKLLLSKYCKYADGCDTISKEGIIKAEAEMLVDELKGSHSYVYSNWKKGASTANSAGQIVCTQYEVPKEYKTKAIDRGNLSEKIYKVMIGE